MSNTDSPVNPFKKDLQQTVAQLNPDGDTQEASAEAQYEASKSTVESLHLNLKDVKDQMTYTGSLHTAYLVVNESSNAVNHLSANTKSLSDAAAQHAMNGLQQLTSAAKAISLMSASIAKLSGDLASINAKAKVEDAHTLLAEQTKRVSNKATALSKKAEKIALDALDTLVDAAGSKADAANKAVDIVVTKAKSLADSVAASTQTLLTDHQALISKRDEELVAEKEAEKNETDALKALEKIQSINEVHHQLMITDAAAEETQEDTAAAKPAGGKKTARS